MTWSCKLTLYTFLNTEVNYYRSSFTKDKISTLFKNESIYFNHKLIGIYICTFFCYNFVAKILHNTIQCIQNNYKLVLKNNDAKKFQEHYII